MILLLLFLPLAETAIAQNSIKVQVRTQSGAKLVDLPLERYVAAVLAGESSIFQSKEALKAMAVAARTYAVRLRGRHSAEGFDFCDTTHCQRIELEGISARLESAAADTAGELLWYQGKPAFTPYTRDCGGRTEEAAAIWPDLAEPYLKSHEDPYCARRGSSAWQWNSDPKRILQALRDSGLRAPDGLNRIAILDRTPSGRASTLTLAGASGSVRISADSFRFAVGRELGWNTLRSDRYQVEASNGRIAFEGSGSGHGVGLCQVGAEQMGTNGRSYRDILAFYYPGTLVGLTGRGLSWQRLSGDSLTMLTTQPDQDRAVLAAAERIERTLAQRTHWPVPPNIELRVYPDLDTFRNATGEPGWVAAHTGGRRIDLQPVAVLRAKGALDTTLTHELAHAFVESQATPATPLWFREGFAEFLEAGRGTGSPKIPAEADLRQTSDAARARQAYAQAQAEVAELIQRYGETTVLDWVKRGLPADVANASASHAAPKSK
ncbi:MAG TPA: SpoIID/LytB domain-containing protein [Bryobacteraceae bacterium]